MHAPLRQLLTKLIGPAAAVAAVVSLSACGSATQPASHSIALQSAGAPTQAFSWLRPERAPRAWRSATLPSGAAQFAYPADWRLIRTDPGTVTAALRDGEGEIAGYLNATHQQASETLDNWSSFRPDHNRDEGDVDSGRSPRRPTYLQVGRGSCLIEDYTHLQRSPLPRDRLHRPRITGDHRDRRRRAARPMGPPGTGDRARHLQLPHMNPTNERSQNMLSTAKARIAAILAVLGIVGGVVAPAAVGRHHHHHHHPRHPAEQRRGPRRRQQRRPERRRRPDLVARRWRPSPCPRARRRPSPGPHKEGASNEGTTSDLDQWPV